MSRTSFSRAFDAHPRGRVATPAAYAHLGMAPPPATATGPESQTGLFDSDE